MNIKIVYQEAKTGKEKTVVYLMRTKKEIKKSLEIQAKQGWFVVEESLIHPLEYNGCMPQKKY